jgi:acyl-CoA thioester hydrolase
MGFVNGRHLTTVRVRYAETDRMGVAYNKVERAGIMLPVREAGVKYLKPAFYDDVLTVVTSINRKPGVRVHIEYEIMRDDETIATGFTEHVFTDAGLHPVKPGIPILDRLSEMWQEKVVYDREEP